MTTITRKFLFFGAINLAICAVVFLFTCDFFSQYDAKALSTNPYNVQDTKVVRVHLVDEQGNFFQRDWALNMVQKANLPVHPDPLSPSVNPLGPQVKKDRFALHYRVIFAGSDVQIIPTTTPYALAMALLTGFLLLFLRNMYVSGNPLLIQKRPRKALKKLAAQGQPAKRRTSKGKGPPPGRKQKGRGRRR